MYDLELKIKSMPPSAVINNFVKGITNSNYEIYLRELINNSSFFLTIGKSKYVAPLSEEAGQCDAISEQYELDFKLLDSQTRLMAASILKAQPKVFCDGVVAYTQCKRSGGSVKATILHAALRNLSVKKLESIRHGKMSRSSIESDISQILEVVEVRKNILMLFPYVFSLQQDICLSDAVEIIGRAMSNDFRNLFLYREKANPEFDTYLTTVFSNFFLIYKIVHGEFVSIEPVPTTSMPTYMELSNYGDIWG